MRHPWSLLPALLAVAATIAPTVASADPAKALSGDDRPGPASRSAAATVRQAASPAPRQDESALGVTIDALSPSYLPAQGPVQVNGTLTNHTDDRWAAINLHLFIADTPITSPEELAEATELDPAEPVGDRITAPGTFDTVTSLEPGASEQFSIRVGRSDLGVTEPGVYWFGVHALGESDEPRDSIADGRARTFLPLVPRGSGSVNTALVIPIRHEVRYAPGGRIIDAPAWAKTLDIGGSLRSLVDFGAAAGSRPVTWLVDPAVPDAVRDLVAGNPPRPLDETVPTTPDGTASPPPLPTRATPRPRSHRPTNPRWRPRVHLRTPRASLVPPGSNGCGRHSVGTRCSPCPTATSTSPPPQSASPRCTSRRDGARARCSKRGTSTPQRRSLRRAVTSGPRHSGWSTGGPRPWSPTRCSACRRRPWPRSPDTPSPSPPRARPRAGRAPMTRWV